MAHSVVEHPSASSRPNQTTAALLFSTGFLLRFGFVVWQKTYIQWPGKAYPFAMEVSSIAASLAREHGYSSPFLHETGPTAWVSPAYPLLVAGAFKVFGVYTNGAALVILGLQCAMAAATGVVIYALGERTLGKGIGLFSAWIWTVSPIFFRWPVSWIWDFALSALLLASILWVVLDVAESGKQSKWLCFGGVWGAAALTNPSLISICPFTYAFAALANRRATRPWLKNVGYSLLLMLALLSPWAIRNQLVFGKTIILRSNFWFEFHLGNYHYSNGMGYLGFHPGANPRELRRYIELGEQGYINWAKREAFAFVRQYPREFVDLTLHRTWWFWDGTSILYQGDEWWKPWEYWPLSATAWLGLIFVFTRRPFGWQLYAACLVVYPLPYYFVYPVAKYRYAIEPEMLLLSVYLASLLWLELRTLTARRRNQQSRLPA
jgi:4-amino-4-deoxy-L-arabinose transferase-like glycosyltransferase